METLPEEIILLFLSYLDFIALVRVSLASKKMHRISKSNHLWKQHCYKHPIVHGFIQALGLEKDLQDKKLDPYLLFQIIMRKDSSALIELIGHDKSISLHIPSYESRQYSFTFFPAFTGVSRHLFLSQEIAAKQIRNIKSVRKFIPIEIPLSGVDLTDLFERGETVTKQLKEISYPINPSFPLQKSRD